MLDKKISSGVLCYGETWREAIEGCMKCHDTGIEIVYKYKNPDYLLDYDMEFSHYQLFGFGNNRKYVRKIPKSLNQFVETLIKNKLEIIRDLLQNYANDFDNHNSFYYATLHEIDILNKCLSGNILENEEIKYINKMINAKKSEIW